MHFLGDGTIVGNSKKVLAVHETSVGRYCVDFASSIHVSEETFVNMTVDWINTASNLTVPTRAASSTCTGLGFSNSVRILVYANDSGTSANQDAALLVTIP